MSLSCIDTASSVVIVVNSNSPRTVEASFYNALSLSPLELSLIWSWLVSKSALVCSKISVCVFWYLFLSYPPHLQPLLWFLESKIFSNTLLVDQTKVFSKLLTRTCWIWTLLYECDLMINILYKHIGIITQSLLTHWL